ncbi:MAG: ornithine carbamoyltransferase [Chloroflexi bacterium]|nr:ornithine carbamoyltransferase [Chloroflexota bacterium]
MEHFLSLADWESSDLIDLIEQAVFLKREHRTGGNRQMLANKSLGMVFQKPSLRTRVSFEMAMKHCGGHALFLGPQEIGLGKRESIADIARVLGSYVDIIMARVFDHAHVEQLAEWSPVPIINGLSDFNHPCQAMADVLTIYEEFGELEGLQVVYLGDSNNVTTSLAFAAAKFGFQLVIASPEGYKMDAETIKRARLLGSSQDTVVEVSDPVEAVQDADVIYTDTWTSMGQEEEAAQRREIFPPYQVNHQLIANAPAHTIVMHCLPAHRGEEITDSIADGPQSRLFQQAENRLHAQKAILVRLLTR